MAAPHLDLQELSRVPLGSSTTKTALADLVRELAGHDVRIGVSKAAGIILDAVLRERDGERHTLGAEVLLRHFGKEPTD